MPIYVPAEICVIMPGQFVDNAVCSSLESSLKYPSGKYVMSEVKRKILGEGWNELSNPTLVRA